MTTEQQICWHCPSYGQFFQREWEEEFFIFNPLSGDTHVLNGLAMEILSLLSTKPSNLDSLKRVILTLTGSAETSDLDSVLGIHIQHLESMGLITPIPCDSATHIKT